MVALLQKRLDEIAQQIAKTGKARALFGLGSIGKEKTRLDEFSDLDFFVIAKNGFKNYFIDHLDWLLSIAPADFYFKNTKDGYKLLYNDGVYCEFAVFEEAELATASFSEGAIIWQEADFDPDLVRPAAKTVPWRTDNKEWATGEIVTCLYVGLCRYLRGEKLSGMRFVQNFAVDILIASSHFFEQDQGNVYRDSYQNDRRVEQRLPRIAAHLPEMTQGYDRTPQSALAILDFVEKYFSVNPAIREKIRELAERGSH